MLRCLDVNRRYTWSNPSNQGWNSDILVHQIGTQHARFVAIERLRKWLGSMNEVLSRKLCQWKNWWTFYLWTWKLTFKRLGCLETESRIEYFGSPRWLRSTWLTGWLDDTYLEPWNLIRHVNVKWCNTVSLMHCWGGDWSCKTLKDQKATAVVLYCGGFICRGLILRTIIHVLNGLPPAPPPTTTATTSTR